MTNPTDLEARVAEFARYIIRAYAWGHREPDGGDVQDTAVRLGLLVETIYDPEKHGENDCGAEAGDPWFEFSAALALPSGEGKQDNSAAAGAAPILTSDAIDGIVHLVVRDVAELPDRTSPAGQEHMMLVAGDELEDIVRGALQAFLAYAPASVGGEAKLENAALVAAIRKKCPTSTDVED